MDKNEIKMKIAIKLVDSLSFKDTSVEDLTNLVKAISSTVTTDNEEIENFIEAYKEYYSVSEMKNKIAEIYSNNLTEDEMLDMINFFNTPTGKVWISKHPIILQEIIKVSEEYGASIAEEILKRNR
jgi:hypothetical protein